METQTTRGITRREALTAAAAAAGGAIAVLATPGTALAANGDPVKLGEDNQATLTTSVTCTGTHAVMATASAGDAFRGVTSGADASGAFGSGAGATSYGVFGYQQTNMGRAALGAPGAALWASQFGAPWGLLVEGKVSLSRSGRATIKAGHKTVDVTVGSLSGTPLCFATLMTYRSGTYVVSVRPNYPSAGKLRININKAPSGPTRVAWLVLG
jgi:hypothetical protein